jgi:hypothetical protein
MIFRTLGSEIDLALLSESLESLEDLRISPHFIDKSSYNCLSTTFTIRAILQACPRISPSYLVLDICIMKIYLSRRMPRLEQEVVSLGTSDVGGE